MTEGDRNSLKPPSWWRFVAGLDSQWINELAGFIRDRKPIPESARLSILLALDHTLQYRDPRGRGRPSKKTQHFWLAVHYLLSELTARSPKDAAITTQEAAGKFGIIYDYRTIQNYANDFEKPAREYLDVAVRHPALTADDPKRAHAILLRAVESQLRRCTDIR